MFRGQPFPAKHEALFGRIFHRRTMLACPLNGVMRVLRVRLQEVCESAASFPALGSAERQRRSDGGGRPSARYVLHPCLLERGVT